MTSGSSTTSSSAASLRTVRNKLDRQLRLSRVFGYESTGITLDKQTGDATLLVVLDPKADEKSVPESFEGLPVTIRYIDTSKFALES